MDKREATAIRAEMARNALLPNQLRPMWSPDHEATVYPLREEDTQKSVYRFMLWLDDLCRDGTGSGEPADE